MTYQTVYKKEKPKTALTLLWELYDKALYRIKDIGSYIDDNSIPYQERERTIPSFEKALKEVNDLIQKIEYKGYKMTKNERLNGFNTDREGDL